MIICGVTDNSINDVLKVFIKQGNVLVVGLIGQGTSRQLQANWNSPFEGATVGNSFLSKLMDIGQTVTGKTSNTTFNSIQNWEGNRPLTFNLVLQFVATDDPVNQVMKPLQMLEEMASPEVNENITGFNWKALFTEQEKFLGQIPKLVAICIGGRTTILNCVIESISTPLDKERDRNGNLLRAEVTLTIQTKQMLNRSDIAGTW